MLTTIFILVPVLFVLFGAVGALSFAVSSESEGAQPERGVGQPVPEVGLGDSMLLFNGPDSWSSPENKIPVGSMSVEQLLAHIENDLRNDRQSAEAFARNPSRNALHLH